LGGVAKVIFIPKSLNELSVFLKNIDCQNQVKVLGVGSNTLIRDGGYNGIIIKFGKALSHLSLFNNNTIIAGSAALDKKVSNFAFEKQLTGFEFLSCIPGTIGGAIRMNSGCYGEDISKLLVSVQVMDLKGKMKVIYASDIKFSYRNCNINDDLIFISATLKGERNKKINIKKKIEDLVNKKKKDQPSKIKTCGSTFKNPEKDKAWRLIKDSGCAGMKVGDAYISEKHCNFFVNRGNAKSSDLEDLIHKVRTKVLDKTGIKLELEIQIIGEKI
jgi:UDP-N-acetylmuramate dehydrogenase